MDIVILADCSGSMGNMDLTEVSETPPSRWSLLLHPQSNTEKPIARIRALQKALNDLLERRLRVAGSSSRIALIAFGDRSELRFPRPTDGTGMIEIDENTRPELVRQFQDTIATLKAETWNTNIGQALQFAASHISQYGKPNNERLIVLISDGADWRARGDDAKGELIENALDEPVSLMEHLHESMSIHLHAIGISSAELYDRYLKRRGEAYTPQHLGHRPNHELLEHLVTVGGGDPTRTGDAQVLEEYLQGLGGGVTRSLHFPRNETTRPPLSQHEREQIANAAQGLAPSVKPSREDRALIDLRDRLRHLYHECNRYCLVFGKYRMFNASPENYNELFEYEIHVPVSSSREFRTFIADVYNVFDEGLAVELRRWKKGQALPTPLDEIVTVLHATQFGQLSVLRHKLVHDGFQGEGAEAARLLAEVYETLIGVKTLARDDAASWLRLQKATLDMLAGVLDQVLIIFGRAQTPGSGDEDSLQPVIRW